jgi:FlaG/FlaF family flagellin (archaellin)
MYCLAVDLRSRATWVLLGAIAVILAACASTSLTNSWTDPTYKGPRLKKLMVMGVSNQPALRRTFEDEFVKSLKAAGVDAVASYQFVPEDGKAEEAKVKEAVTKAGADGVLITRLVRVDVNTQAAPAYPATMGMGFYGGYTGAWGGFYDPPVVTQTDTLVLETNLYGVDASRLLWSGTTDTFAPTNMKQEMPDFSKLIIGQLKSHKLI